MSVEIRDVAPGLWLWRQPHWEWREGDDWEPEVSSFVVESGADVVLLDPLAPPPGSADGRAVYDRLEASPPTAIVVLKPDHVRDVDQFAHWYDIPAYGPWLFWQGDAPRTPLSPARVGTELPGRLRPLHDGRGAMETPLYLPEQRAIAFADGMAAPGGVLRVWWSPALAELTLPALRAMLELPFEMVLVSHGEPVHSRAEFEAALEREPWSVPDDAKP
jgi:hypothetical protein